MPDRRAGVSGQLLNIHRSERIGFLCPYLQKVRFPDPRIGFLPVRLSGGRGEDGRQNDFVGVFRVGEDILLPHEIPMRFPVGDLARDDPMFQEVCAFAFADMQQLPRLLRAEELLTAHGDLSRNGPAMRVCRRCARRGSRSDRTC